MTTDTGVKLEEVWPAVSFSSPVALLQAPGEPDRFYVVEQSGKVKVLTAGATSATDFLSYPAGDISTGGAAYTEEIQKALSVSWDEAERMKIGGRGEGESQDVVPQEV